MSNNTPEQNKILLETIALPLKETIIIDYFYCDFSDFILWYIIRICRLVIYPFSIVNFLSEIPKKVITITLFSGIIYTFYYIFITIIMPIKTRESMFLICSILAWIIFMSISVLLFG
jgi:hypothetical protein